MCVCVRTHTHRWVRVVCTTSQERVACFLFFLWTFVLEAIPVPILHGHCFCRYAWLIAAASQLPTERGVACLHLPGWRAQSSPTVATRASPQPGVQIPARHHPLERQISELCRGDPARTHLRWAQQESFRACADAAVIWRRWCETLKSVS